MILGTAAVSTAPHGCPHPARQCNGDKICHEIKSCFIPQKHSTSHPESRTPLILFKLKDSSELPDSVWFLKAHAYFKQLDVKRNTSTGFAFDYICLNLSLREASVEPGKKRPRCHPWQLGECSRPDSPRLALQNPHESSHLLAHRQGARHGPAPSLVSSPLLLRKAKGFPLANCSGCLHYSWIFGDFFFPSPNLCHCLGSVPGFWLYLLLPLLEIPFCVIA